ncbi:hypothetical protein [Streptomyces sp. KL116D]|uniref:hypothetical protein n=1 Tax=Streptomyces sp. KL116D TaxID=3045152 RepID=UPI003556244A
MTSTAFSHKPVLTGRAGRAAAVHRGRRRDQRAGIIAIPRCRTFNTGGDTALTLERLREWYGSRGAQDDRLDLAVTDRATRAGRRRSVLNEWDPAHRGAPPSAP